MPSIMCIGSRCIDVMCIGSSSVGYIMYLKIIRKRYIYVRIWIFIGISTKS